MKSASKEKAALVSSILALDPSSKVTEQNSRDFLRDELKRLRSLPPVAPQTPAVLPTPTEIVKTIAREELIEKCLELSNGTLTETEIRKMPTAKIVEYVDAFEAKSKKAPKKTKTPAPDLSTKALGGSETIDPAPVAPLPPAPAPIIPPAPLPPAPPAPSFAQGLKDSPVVIPPASTIGAEAPKKKYESKTPADSKYHNRDRSTAVKPCDLVWAICNESRGNLTRDRKTIIALCVEAGVHPGTAATQYSRWKANEDAQAKATEVSGFTKSPIEG